MDEFTDLKNLNLEIEEGKEAVVEEIVELSKSKKDKDDNKIFISYFENDDIILEQIGNATLATHATRSQDMKYICFDKKTGVTTEKLYHEENGKKYYPIIDDLTATGTILLPTGVQEYETDKELIKSIGKFLNENFEVEKFYEKFLPYLVLFYNVYDKFPFVPYVHFVGLTSTGKTTAMEVFGSICYKPIDASGSITMSPIFRTASTWRGTLMLDEFDSAGDNYKEMLSFLKSGVGNRSVLRTEGDKKREVRAYLIKSPKIFTSENPINNAGLQSRTIVVRMKKNKRRIPLYRLGKFIKQSEILRNQILLWRLRNLSKIDLDEIEYGFPELAIFDRRVQQVITPIYYLSDEDTRKDIVKFASEQQEETMRERRESVEGQIFQTISNQYPNSTTISTIFEEVNKGVSEKYQLKPKRIANIIRKIFGFDIERFGHENDSTVVVEKEKYEELCNYYNISISPERVASVASVANSVVTDKTIEDMFGT